MFATAVAGGVFGVAPSRAAAAGPNACALLSPSDLHRFFGKSWVVVSHKATPPEKSHCQWGPPGSDGKLMVQILPAHQYIDGDAKVPGVGEKAALDNVDFVFGIKLWRGRAVKGDNAVNFTVSSKGVSRSTALDVLKQLVARM
jgi:hypothetical protein